MKTLRVPLIVVGGILFLTLLGCGVLDDSTGSGSRTVLDNRLNAFIYDDKALFTNTGSRSTHNDAIQLCQNQGMKVGLARFIYNFVATQVGVNDPLRRKLLDALNSANGVFADDSEDDSEGSIRGLKRRQNGTYHWGTQLAGNTFCQKR